MLGDTKKERILSGNTNNTKDINPPYDNDLLDYVKNRKQWLESLIGKKEAELSTAPEGHLRVLDRKTYAEYYWRTKASDPNGKFLPKKKWNIARGLAQKDYDSKLVSTAKKELKLITKYLDFAEANDMSKVFDDLSNKRKELVKPFRLPDEDYIKIWTERDYDRMGFENDSAEYYSNNGIRVRSKSEIIIANMLEKYNVPFRYEYPLKLNRKWTVRPDFTCLNVRTRQEFIWEHFGMMDDEEYANKNITKISNYEEGGYLSGRNLIMTFESLRCPLNTNIVKLMINTYLI